MSFSRGNDGEKVMTPEVRSRLRDSDVARARSAQMLVQKLSGWKTGEIARYFRLTTRHVNREIKAIPSEEKKRIAGRFRRGEISVG